MSDTRFQGMNTTLVPVLACAGVVSGIILWKRSRDESKNKQQKKAKVIILGDIFLDINASSGKLPSWGCDLIADKAIEAMAGGSALNTATHLSGAFGTKSSVWSAIGNDFWGDIIRIHTKKHAIDLRGNLNCAATAVCMVISGDSDRGFLTYRGPMETLSLGQNGLDIASIVSSVRHTDHFHIAGYYNCPCLWDEPSANILCLARSKGATTSLNCQYDTTGQWAHLKCVLPHADFVFLNCDEALAISKCGSKDKQKDPSSSGDMQYTQKDVEKAAEWFLDNGVVVAIITQGKEGALALVKSSSGKKKTLVQVGCCDKMDNIPLVDTTGAGDAFISGFLYGFQDYVNCEGDGMVIDEEEGPSNIGAIAKALRWGVAAGCTCVGQFGASSAFSYAQVSSLLPTPHQVVSRVL